ncbi:MAG: BadF/BadG/BcrA/BcrD ATPase family protein, partial [Draconibacterium sp.]
VNEVAAAIEGSVFLNPEVKSIIEIGGQSARYYTGLSGQQGNTLRISKRNRLQMASNSDCAAGTGSFLEEQASRLNIDINHYSEFVQRAKTVPRIAGRCSVFAKTDIIHHQQEGLPSEDILKGVAYAIVKNYKGAVIRRLPVESPMLFIGGVVKNQAIVDALRDVLHKTESELIVPKHFDIANSIGAALIAKKENFRLNFRKVFWDCLTLDETAKKTNSEDLIPLSRLAQEDITTKHVISPPKINSSEQAFFLGVDIGSTSTNLVLINPDGDVVAFEYIRT